MLDQVGNPEELFSHDEAHMMSKMLTGVSSENKNLSKTLICVGSVYILLYSVANICEHRHILLKVK